MDSGISRYGVVYDLAKSPFQVECAGMTFSFSNLAHAQKFERDVAIKQEWLTDSMSRRFHFVVDCDKLAALQLYERIEGRGFMVELPDGSIVRDKSLLACTFDVRC